MRSCMARRARDDESGATGTPPRSELFWVRISRGGARGGGARQGAGVDGPAAAALVQATVAEARKVRTSACVWRAGDRTSPRR